MAKVKQLNLKDDTVFQQDGATCHFALHIRPFLNLEFPNRWIGSGGPFSWLLHLPDLTPLNFFVGTCENNCVCDQT